MTNTAKPSAGELADSERLLFEEARKAYFKAGETSDPQHWMEAALLAQQHRNALVALRSAQPVQVGKDWSGSNRPACSYPDMAQLSASEVACYRWPDNAEMRQAFCDGAAHIASACPSVASADAGVREALELISEAVITQANAASVAHDMRRKARTALAAPPSVRPSHIERTEAGVINWKMEAERANRLLAEAEARLAALIDSLALLFTNQPVDQGD